MKSVTIIGAGAVGRSIALALFTKKVTIGGIYSENGKSAQALAKKVQCYNFGSLDNGSLNFEIVIIAVPDSRICDVVRILSKNIGTLKNKIIFHTSGVLASDELGLLRKKGAAVGSFHPLQTFARSKKRTPFKNIWCTVEGDRKAVTVAHSLGDTLNANVFTISRKDKVLYHASAVFASNYLVTLLSVVETIAEFIKIPKKNIWKIYSPLILQTIQNVITSSPKMALTGPIVRGDIKTIEKHIKALSNQKLKHIAELYAALGIETTRLVREKNAR